MNGATPSCLAAIHIDECREQMEMLMTQDLEGSYRVARTKVRHHEALARNVQEHDERARKIAKHGHHEAGPNQRQSCHHRHAV